MVAIPVSGELTGEWDSAAPGARPSMTQESTVFAAPKVSTTGKVHPHVLKDGADPVRRQNYSFQAYLTDYADVLTFWGYHGRTMYFIPNYHDQASHDTDYIEVYVERLGNLDARGYDYDAILLPVRLLDVS